MNEVWNLERMYSGFDDPKYLADFAAFEKKIGEFISFTEPANIASRKLLEKLGYMDMGYIEKLTSQMYGKWIHEDSASQ